jgi:hypothetical protein
MGKSSANEDDSRTLASPVQASETYAKAQDDEIEVLQAIYMEDFEDIELKGAWSVSVIHGIACAPSQCSASKGYAYVIRVAHKLESIALVVSDQVANDLYRKPQIVHSNYG